jgi:uncharacterized protein
MGQTFTPHTLGDMSELRGKLRKLEEILVDMGSTLVAFSGGVDSTFMLRVANNILGSKAMAATAFSPLWSSAEFEAAKGYASRLGIKQIVLNFSDILDDKDFSENPPNRCYICKRGLFGRLMRIASQHDLNCVADGTNFSDAREHRPGMQAAEEIGIRSPLYEVKLTKLDVRKLLKEMNLPTWDKPSSSCLATRFPYGTRITRKRLAQVAKGEEFLRGLALTQVRLRYYEDTARIEVDPAKIGVLINGNLRRKIIDKFKELGYTYITLDLEGYRPESMDETLKNNIELS